MKKKNKKNRIQVPDNRSMPDKCNSDVNQLLTLKFNRAVHILLEIVKFSNELTTNLHFRHV